MQDPAHIPFRVDPTTTRAMRGAAVASTIAAVLMIIIKLIAWLLTGSVAMLASMLDSIADLGASLTNFMAIRVALSPPDSEHRYGHGKAEPLAGLAQSVLIAGSALFVVLSAVDRLKEPQPLQLPAVGIVVAVLAILITAGLLLIQRRAIRLSGSSTIRADALHYLSDFAGYIGLILAFVLESMGITGADPIIGILIAMAILLGVGHIVVDSVNQLMDRELSPEMQQRVTEIALNHPEILAIHDLRTRRSGQHRMIQLHLEMDESLTLTRAHAAADAVEKAIMSEFPGADVITHQDPVPVSRVRRVAQNKLAKGGVGAAKSKEED